MNIQGTLHDVGVPGVIDLALRMNMPILIHLLLEDAPDGHIYLDENRVVHAEFGTLHGMEALTHLFLLDNGEFTLQPGELAPQITIDGDWNAVLLDILYQLDHETAAPATPSEKHLYSPISSLQTLLEDADLEGSAIVGRDGLPLAIHLPVSDLDEDLLGALAASIFALSDRSVQQLKRGSFRQTLIQGKQGNLIVTQITQDTLLVAVVSTSTSLGMAFAETHRLAKAIAKSLKQ